MLNNHIISFYYINIINLILLLLKYIIDILLWLTSWAIKVSRRAIWLCSVATDSPALPPPAPAPLLEATQLIDACDVAFLSANCDADNMSFWWRSAALTCWTRRNSDSRRRRAERSSVSLRSDERTSAWCAAFTAFNSSSNCNQFVNDSVNLVWSNSALGSIESINSLRLASIVTINLIDWVGLIDSYWFQVNLKRTFD